MVLGFNDRITVPQSINESHRFGLVVCGMLSSIAAGAIYAFSLISGKMTDDYKFTQNDITTVSTVGIVFGYFTIPFGFIFDYIGPKIIFLIGITAYSLGALLFALTFQDTIGHSVASLSVINAVMNIGCSMFDMGAILSVISWFPLDRGLLVASIKTMIGMSGSVIATLQDTYFRGQFAEYMYFLLALVMVIGILCFVFIQIPPYHMTGHRIAHYTEEEHYLARQVEHKYLTKKAPRWRFLFIFAIVLSLLIVISVQSILFVFEDDVPFEKRNPPAIIMIILCFALVFSFTPENMLPGCLRPKKSDDNALCNNEGEATDTINEEKLFSNDDKNFPQYQTSFFQNSGSNIPLWCIWINAIILSGGVHIVALNSRQIYTAVSGDQNDNTRPSLYVALTSVGNAIGRLCVSFFEAWNASRPLEKRMPITITYCVPALLMFFSYTFFLFVPAEALLLPMILSGLANGGYAAALVLTVRTIYSIDIAKHYNSIFFFDLVGVIFFNRLLFGEIMTKNSSVDENGATLCLDRSRCLQTIFIVMVIFSVIAFVASLAMHFVYQRYVRSVWQSHTKEPHVDMQEPTLRVEEPVADGHVERHE